MPFPTFPQPQLPPALVEVLFKGLIIIRPNAGGTCSIWVHTAPDDHFLIIEIRGRSTTRGDFLVARHTGPIQGAPLTIGFDQGSAGVSAFRPTGPIFDRITASDTRDLRWAIDLEHPEFFATPLGIDQNVPQSIEMQDGIFFTADVTDERDLDVGRKRSLDYRNLRRISTVLCANVTPPPGRSVVLNRAGTPGWPITLPRAGDGPNARYRVSVRNDPLAIDFEPTHDELERYYQLVRSSGGAGIPEPDQFQLEVRPRGSARRSSDQIPCMPILLGA